MWSEINTSTANSSWLPVSSCWSVRPAASTSGSLSVWWGGLLAKWRTVCRPAMIGKEPVWPGWRGVLARHFPYNWPDLRASRADCEPVLCAVVAAQKGGTPVRLRNNDQCAVWQPAGAAAAARAPTVSWQCSELRAQHLGRLTNISSGYVSVIDTVFQLTKIRSGQTG